MAPIAPELAEKLRRIKCVVMDVDGVLTDGGMYYTESGDALKKFNAKDGMGIELLHGGGIVTAFVTASAWTNMVERRGQKLQVQEIHQGVMDKEHTVRGLAAKYGFALDEVAYIGDDVNDVQALRIVGFAVSPADGMPQVKEVAHYICRNKGGDGAVREMIDLILRVRREIP